MKAEFKAENPDSIEMTLTITMDMLAWKKLRKDLDDVEQVWLHHPANSLRTLIREMVELATTHFEQKGGD